MAEADSGLFWLASRPDASGPDFAEFFRATWPRLFRTAAAITGNRTEAEDALQTAYAKAYARWRRIQDTDRPEAYVRKMVVNEILGRRRAGFGLRERATETVEDPSAVPSPEPGLLLRDQLWTSVQALPRRQRAVIVLRYYEDLSEAAIAETLGCSRGTVKSQASAALATLRRLHAEAARDEEDA